MFLSAISGIAVTSKELKIKIRANQLLILTPEASLPTGAETAEEMGEKKLDGTELDLKQRLAAVDGGMLYGNCVPDESTWSVEKTKDGLSVLTVTLAKATAGVHWPMLLREE